MISVPGIFILPTCEEGKKKMEKTLQHFPEDDHFILLEIYTHISLEYIDNLLKKEQLNSEAYVLREP